jgi:hypothetical protein
METQQRLFDEDGERGASRVDADEPTETFNAVR